MPAFEVVPNFPFPKFWSRDFWRALRMARSFQADIVNTHTRFFLSSFVGGVFAKMCKIPWIHIEHGSDYVLLDSHFKTFVARVYDETIGRCVFFFSDAVIPISGACKVFIERFIKRDMSIFYRGLDIAGTAVDTSISDLKGRFPDKTIIGFIGRLYKWKNVESFIRAYYLLDPKEQENIQPIIVGYGEDLERLKKLDYAGKFYFTGGVDSRLDLATQGQFDIHIHSSSPGGGLATTLLQAMYLGCFIVSTPYEGADEVMQDGVNGILLPDDRVESIRDGIRKALVELPMKRETFARENGEIIRKQFSWNSNIENYRRFFSIQLAKVQNKPKST